MNFSLSAAQRELTEAAADFARRELNRDLVTCEDAREFWREAWQACARFGVHGLPVPAERGGRGQGDDGPGDGGAGVRVPGL
ncbi:MAG: acyl-CoA dehydrogenase family protein [Mycobacterium sp.]